MSTQASGRVTMIVAMLSASLCVAATPNMKEGEWEITTTMEVAGMPGMSAGGAFGGQPMTVRRCYTRQDIDNKRSALDSARAEKNCKARDFNTSGNKMTFKMECEGRGGKTTGSGEFTYHANAYEGVMKTRMQSERRGEMEMTTRVAGKRLGDCK
jgi:hypothetical protein